MVRTADSGSDRSGRRAARLSRRHFLRGVTSVAMGASAAGLLAACAPQAPSAPASSGQQAPAQSVATAVVPKDISGAATAAPAAPAAAAAPTQAAPASKPAEAKPAEAKPAAAAPTPAPAAKTGGTLIAAQEVDPVQLDPYASSNFSALQAYEFIYESLTGYDEKTQIVPALAERWETPNDTTYVFHLRKGVKFHNGQEMTGADVAYSLETAVDEKTGSPWRSLLTPIKSVEVKDPYTVQVNLTSPYPGLLGAFSVLRASAIIPKDWYKNNNPKLQAMGTGPFKLAEFVPTDHVTYQRHTDYWDKGRPQLEGMTFKIMLDQNARIAALRSGQIQMATLDAQGAEQLKGQAGLQVLSSPSAWLTTHPFNVSRKPFDDKRVRQALRMAVDTKEVIQKAVFGAGVPSGAIATGFGDWALPESELKYTKPDVEGAKKLLAEAGHPNGFATTILCSPQYPEFVATSLVCQEAWKKLGVDAKVEQVEWGTYVKRASKAAGFDYDIGATAFTFRPDPDGYLYLYYKTGGDSNTGYSDPKMDDLLEQARVTTDQAKRKQLYLEIQKMAEDEALWMYWYVKNNIEAVTDKVGGYKQSFTQRRIFLKDTTVG
ncbi:MAG TPA: ABC transporter substrate-binding protein [Chloroflexota bacterium]|nr:ABC transporter substrate-binding protein [Chloroflexota bacterium]